VRWLVRLYPPAWRRRYEDEFLEVLQSRGVGRAEALDIARGAYDAWVRGPRGDLGFVGIALALVVYGAASWMLAATRRAWVGPADGPLETIYQSLYWLLSILFMTWLASRPSLRCDMTGLIARLRR
jgi:hypothetical protein